MNHDDPLDATLRRHFDTLRTLDRAQAPDFASMAARARQTAAQTTAQTAAPTVEHKVDHTVALTTDAITSATPVLVPIASPTASPRRRTISPWAWGIPALAAAALAAVMLVPRGDAADQEFEALVADWSRTTQLTMRAPTDGLLAVPGSEYLRFTPSLSQPSFGIPAASPSSPGSSRPRSPS